MVAKSKKSKFDNDSQVFYFRIDKKLLKGCKRIEKATGTSFTKFLEGKAKFFLDIGGINNELYETLEYCSRCGNPSELELSSYFMDSSDDTGFTVHRVLCPICVQAILNNENLTALETSFKEQLKDPDMFTDWAGFRVTVLEDIHSNDYELMGKGIFRTKNEAEEE